MIKLEFSPEQLKLLDKAVQNLPYFQAASLIAHINKQLQLHNEADVVQFDEGMVAKNESEGKR